MKRRYCCYFGVDCRKYLANMLRAIHSPTICINPVMEMFKYTCIRCRKSWRYIQEYPSSPVGIISGTVMYSCRSVASGLKKNRRDDLGAPVPPKVKSCNLRRTKHCASFRLINLISEHILYKHSSEILLQILLLYLPLIFFLNLRPRKVKWCSWFS